MSTVRPRVSVILTSYNQACFLPAALESIGKQSWRDFEVVAVDDGSTDETLDILNSFARENDFVVRVLPPPNGRNVGIVATYSRGIAQANGTYLAFLEADDAWSPDYLIQKVRVLDQLPHVGVVFSPCSIILEGCFGIDMMVRQRVLQSLIPRLRPFDNFKWLLQKNNVATFSTFVARADLVRSVRPPRNLRLCFFDWWLLTHLSLRTRFYLDTRSRAFWRHSRGSFMGKQSFAEHRTTLTTFLEALYRSVEPDLPLLSAAARDCFARKRRGQRSFVSFYQRPTLLKWARFCRDDPFWALETLPAYLVNKFKFSPPSSVVSDSPARVETKKSRLSEETGWPE